VPRDERSYCRICAAACGIVVTIDGDRVVRVRGDDQHPVSRGYTCSKGRGIAAWHHASNRLDRPRVGGRECTWDELLTDLGARLDAVIDADGPDAVALYLATGMAYDAAGHAQPVHALWHRRHSTKFNGVSYPIQKAAAAIYTDAGKQETSALINHYLANAKLIRDAMTKLGFTCIGGDNAPYIWVNTGRDSWEFFDLLLNQAQVVCTPGAGFGKCGEGHVRISAFNSRENVETSLARIAAALK